MIISNCKVDNFTVFDNASIEFCTGVNVIIGANGTGKSHLLKVLYAEPTPLAPYGGQGLQFGGSASGKVQSRTHGGCHQGPGYRSRDRWRITLRLRFQ